MIGRLRGQLLELNPPQMLVDVNGLGYELEAPMSTIFALPKLGSEVILHTHFVVREDAQLLFGFLSEDERQMFRELLRINGVGAKMALAVLSTLSTSDLLDVIENEDVDQLVRVPGIGRKTADRVLLDLRGRMSRFDQLKVESGPGNAAASAGRPRAEAIDALQALGYSASEARKLTGKVDESVQSAQEIIRLALQAAAR